MAKPINRENFTAAVAELRSTDVKGRVVDVLTPLRDELTALRQEGRTFLEIWGALGRAGLECSYPNFIRAMYQVLSGPVRPLAEARARSRARRAGRQSLPRVPIVLTGAAERPPSVTAGATTGGDPYQQAATQQVAQALVATFGKRSR